MREPIAWGLDPAFRSTGIAIIELGASQSADRVLHVETKLTEASPKKARVLVADDDARCIREIAAWLEEMADAYPPVVLCAELPAGAKGAKAHHALGIAKGILCTFATLREGLPLAVCTPRQLKTATTGKANANKDEVKFCLLEDYPEVLAVGGPTFHKTKKRWEHEADALGAFHACRSSDVVRMARRLVAAP